METWWWFRGKEMPCGSRNAAPNLVIAASSFPSTPGARQLANAPWHLLASGRYGVVVAIQRVLELEPTQEKDDLDGLSSNFSTIQVLNDFFPDEASLAHIDEVNAKLNETQAKLQQELDALEDELRSSQMSRIREKATESEAVVRNITKDIQVLDLAKKNLILSLTIMKRLQMLVNALTQLEGLIKEKKYGDASQTLSAIKEISVTFKAYTSVPHISRVWKRIQEIQGELRTQLEGDFDAFFVQDPSKGVKPGLIAEACQAVDVIGPEVRTQLLERFVALELKEYRRIFRTSDEAGQLDNISRRFAWFKRLLQSHEMEQGRVFPADWRVSWWLLAKFAEITRDDMTVLLAKAAPNLSVKSLLEHLQITAEFEASMSKKWATPFHDMLKTVAANPSNPPKPITAAFDAHMNIFVDAQDKVLADMLAPHRKPKNNRGQPRTSLETQPAAPDEESFSSSVLPSSTELFYLYGQILEQCAKLSTGKALFDLAGVQRKWLRIYAEEVLTAQAKRPSNVQPRKSMETRIDPEILKQTCLLINTADYCQTTAQELEQKIKQKVDEEYKEKISFHAECDLFISAVSSAISALLRELESAIDPAFTVMGRISWANLSEVTGPSPYTSDLVKAIDKYLILVKFTHSLVRSRPLKEIGAEQLLIDLQVVNYTKSLTKTTTRLESLLKALVTPVDPPETFVLNYSLHIGDASLSNFQKVNASLFNPGSKGTSKAAEHALADAFLVFTSTKTDLESTSFLSSLDMDPPSTALVGGSLLSPAASKVSLPSLVGGGASEGIFASMVAPPMSGPPTGTSVGDTGATRGEKREVFSDFRRFVTFGLRKDSVAPS
ncbi:Vps53-like protein [Cyathus striatus]|nr:Vps53-like protein [Cyathus striatus]